MLFRSVPRLPAGRRAAGLPPVRVDSNMDVPAVVYQHAVLCEYAHARLRQLAAGDAAGPWWAHASSDGSNA